MLFDDEDELGLRSRASPGAKNGITTNFSSSLPISLSFVVVLLSDITLEMQPVLPILRPRTRRLFSLCFDDFVLLLLLLLGLRVGPCDGCGGLWRGWYARRQHEETMDLLLTLQKEVVTVVVLLHNDTGRISLWVVLWRA